MVLSGLTCKGLIVYEVHIGIGYMYLLSKNQLDYFFSLFKGDIPAKNSDNSTVFCLHAQQSPGQTSMVVTLYAVYWCFHGSASAYASIFISCKRQCV